MEAAEGDIAGGMETGIEDMEGEEEEEEDTEEEEDMEETEGEDVGMTTTAVDRQAEETGIGVGPPVPVHITGRDPPAPTGTGGL